jgi:hypothetical protein
LPRGSCGENGEFPSPSSEPFLRTGDDCDNCEQRLQRYVLGSSNLFSTDTVKGEGKGLVVGAEEAREEKSEDQKRTPGPTE